MGYMPFQPETRRSELRLTYREWLPAIADAKM
jgi:hypothetical protein